MKKQLSKLDKWLIVFTVFDISLILIFGILIYFLHFHNRLEYKEYNGPEVTKLNFEGASPYMEDVILDINRRTNTNYVIRFDEELNGGRTNIISNVIEINPYMTVETFTWVYAHEILHHKFFTQNELFVEFETFKFLYESDNPFYRHSAVCELMNMGPHNKDYDVRYYIYNYLEQKEN